MENIEVLRSRLVEKIFSTQNSNLLQAIDDLFKAIPVEPNGQYIFSESQIEMLKIAEEDIKYGKVMSDEDVRKMDEEWMK